MKDPKLVRRYRVLDQDIAAFDDKLHGRKAHEKQVFIPTAANLKMMSAELSALCKRHKVLDAPDEVFSIVKDHTRDFLDSLEKYIADWSILPSIKLGRGEAGVFTNIIRRDTRPDDIRFDILYTRAAQIDDYFAAVYELLKELPVAEINSALARLSHTKMIFGIERKDAPPFFKILPADELRKLLDRMKEIENSVIPKWMEKIEKLVTEKGGVANSKPRDESEILAQDIEAYRKALAAHDVDLDEILNWHEAEVEKTRAECLEIANRLNIPEKPVRTMTEVNDILFKYEGPASSAEEMFERAKEYVTRGTAAAREYVWLPEDAQCPPMVMYKQMKASYPWGAGGSSSPYSRPFDGHFMLNDENYMNITDGWIKINCTHEVHPGHYTQSLRCLLDPLPETFKRGAKNTCMTEAPCLRTEKLLEYIFAEDPFYPLFTAYRRHHTSVRIMVDLYLRYFGKTIGDAVDLYVRELGFARDTARKQVQAHENDFGYFTTYYYGYKKVAEWEKFYGFEKHEYTELLFSLGRTSLGIFERFLKLSPEDRFSLTHEFASLDQFR